MLDTTRPLLVHDLVYVEQGDDVTVGRRDVDSYGVFPADGAQALRRLAEGHSPAAVRAWFNATYGVDLDVEDFVATLDELGFLRSTDEESPDPMSVAAVPGGRPRWARAGDILFGPLGWTVMTATIIGALAVMRSSPEYVPHAQHIFFTQSLLLMDLGIFAMQVPLILWHESFHVVAGRRLGLRTSLSVGWRAWFVVVETHLDGLVSVPRRARVLPMLAGLVADAVAVAVLVLGSWALREHPGWAAVLQAAAFGAVMRMAWQFFVCLRTDLYYLATVVLGTVDLYRTSLEALANRAAGVLRRPAPHDPARWHPRDAAIARWYQWVVLGGVVILGLVALWGIIPALIGVTDRLTDRATGATPLWLRIDGILFIVLNIVQVVLPVALARRRRSLAPAGGTS